MTAPRPVLTAILAIALLAAPLAAEAQPAGKMPRVGYIFATTSSEGHHYWEAARQGLRELGYVEGQNLALEIRWAEGRYEPSPAWWPSWSASRWTS